MNTLFHTLICIVSRVKKKKHIAGTNEKVLFHFFFNNHTEKKIIKSFLKSLDLTGKLATFHTISQGLLELSRFLEAKVQLHLQILT